MVEKEVALKEFQKIPGVGKSISNDMWNIGLRSLNQLKTKNPENLYVKLCEYQNVQVDRCVLYVFRCAVYFASHKKHKPELLKWWNWMDDDKLKIKNAKLKIKKLGIKS
jgi:hypothetical protein